MGYDRARFSSNVDDEFLCSICVLVIENPVQTPCEHLFCNKCIQGWLRVNKTCPVDGRPLTTDNLSEPNRVLRNLLNKFDIKCDFELDGCKTITKLENLGHHTSKCEYNSSVEIVCDKGCNMTITRREYQVNNCFSHLVTEVTKLRWELCEQKCNFESTVLRLDEEIRKLRYEQGRQNENVENSENRQKQELAELCADILLGDPPQWQHIHNMTEGPMNLLEMDYVVPGLQAQPNAEPLPFLTFRNESGTSGIKSFPSFRTVSRIEPVSTLRTKNQNNPKILLNFYKSRQTLGKESSVGVAFVQSHVAVDRAKPRFKIHCTTLEDDVSLYMGLTRRGYFRDRLSYDVQQRICDIYTRVDRANHYLFNVKCKNGDVIECGVEFPQDFINDGNGSAPVYLSVNRKLIFKETCVIPGEELFPTIILFRSVKIRYCQ